MSEIVNSEATEVPVDDVAPHPDNPRIGDLAAIRESIRINGFYGALVVQRSTGHIVAGNHRWAAARAEGLDEVPVIYIDVDDATARRILAADNRTADLAGYDDRALLELLNDIDGVTGLVGTGYDDDDLAELLARVDRAFDPGGPGDQGALDERNAVTCPECGHTFAP